MAQTLPNDPYTELGYTGLDEFSGQIQADFLREWRGKEAYKRANEMRLNSPVVGSLLFAVEQSIRACSWQFTSDKGENDPRLEICNLSWKRMKGGANNHIIEALTMLPFGYSLFEQVYVRDGSYALLDKLAPRGQDTVYRWLLAQNGDIEGVEQVTGSGQRAVLAYNKLLHYRTRVERNNPEGRSILRTAWIPYYFQKHLQQIEAIGIERDLSGLPVVTLPDGANTDENDTTSDASKAAKIVRNIRNDEQAGLVKPFGWEFELASTGGARAFDTDKIIRRYESRILMSALAQFLLLGQDGVGSLALSGDQSDFFTMAINTIASIISDTFTDQIIPNLMILNGYDADGLKLEHSPAGKVDVTALSDFLQKAGDKITWDANDEAWLRNVGGLPERDPAELAAEQETRRKERSAIAERIAQGTQNNRNSRNDREQEDQDEMRAAYFAARPQDEKKRRALERKWESAMDDFFSAQRKRILKSAREMKNGGQFESGDV